MTQRYLPASRCSFRFAVYIITCVTLLALATCGKDSPTKTVTQPQPPQPPAPPPPIPSQPARISITPESVVLISIGQVIRLSATVYDNHNAAISGASITWQSSDTAVATISPQGLVTAVGNGTANVTARSGAISDRIQVKVMVTPQDREELIALYHATDGPNWTKSTNWLSDKSLGEWHGVTADDIGVVSRVVLSDNNLSGSLPNKLGDLANLKQLDLSSNPNLSGPIPNSFTRLSLEELDLESTQLCAPSTSEFQEWLNNIPDRNVTNCTKTQRDYHALATVYRFTNGPDWTDNTNWLSEAPLDAWYGVDTNSDGEVIRLTLHENNLNGPIPPALGNLESLNSLWIHGNELSGPIPPELGNLSKLEQLSLSQNRLSNHIPSELGNLKNLNLLWISNNHLYGMIPSELGQLENLTDLSLYDNDLSGPIPPEFGRLQNLTFLDLHDNQLSSSVPPELGNLSKLVQLSLSRNRLSNHIPPELGNLKNLDLLWIHDNQLSGPIPPELGNISKLEQLSLSYNQLSNHIPPELGNLKNLDLLWIHDNQLTGPIPPELGRLQNLTSLDLHDNQLTESIPPELGNLSKLEQLLLSHNRLSGNIPQSFGDLTGLKSLILTANAGLSGVVPPTLTNLNLEEFLLGGTQLCMYSDSNFQDWLRGIPLNRVAVCDRRVGGSTAYLIQATQSIEYPVPLVAGKDALLRVFITSESDLAAALPLVRATFYDGGTEVYAVDIPGTDTPIPQEIEEGNLSVSANALIPGSIISQGLEMVINIDPHGELDPAVGIRSRLPPGGRLAVDVVSLPRFELTLVPFIGTENPDESYVAQVQSVSAISDVFRKTRNLLPVGEFVVDIYETQWISGELRDTPWTELFRLTKLISNMEGATGHYMGTARYATRGGWAEQPGRVILAGIGLEYDDEVIAHELGHNLNLSHVPCGDVFGFTDPDYPYPDGSIGAWGYDLLEGRLVEPSEPDLMGYCRPVWISDYQFNKAMGYRRSKARETPFASAYAPSSRSLLLWGGVNSDGEVLLEPAFVVDASPSLPDLYGPYLLTGEDDVGGTLFNLSFDMAEIADSDGERAFAFIIPASAEWSYRLAHITLSGPEGVATLGGDEGVDDRDDLTATLLLDPTTGKVRGLLRDWPEPGITAVSARRVLPEPGLEVHISSGVPAPADWRR